MERLKVFCTSTTSEPRVSANRGRDALTIETRLTVTIAVELETYSTAAIHSTLRIHACAPCNTYSLQATIAAQKLRNDADIGDTTSNAHHGWT